MTDREKAIVMAYTGVTMLTGDKYQIFHKYVEKIMGRPIWTHEMVQFADEIKEKLYMQGLMFYRKLKIAKMLFMQVEWWGRCKDN